jgi:CHAT domain-containing protein/Flp pilus assembly protein TadD
LTRHFYFAAQRESSLIVLNSRKMSGMCIRARALGTLPLILGLALQLGCSRRRDPQAAFDHAVQTLRRGDAAAAASEAEKGYKDFYPAGPEWAWKFTILRARILYQRSMNDEVLKLLASEPSPLPPGELTVQKLRWQSLAYASMHRFPEAEQKLSEAERFCAALADAACADVVDARGEMEMERGQYAQAQVFFERVLASARVSGDRSREASTLLDLSWSADEQTHYDEALDWANAARGIAIPNGFDRVAETALGNMGWAYYRLGDPEKAESMFVEARKQAEKIGDISGQVSWLTNAGYIYMDARDFATAEQSFRQSLDLARRVNSREDVVNSLIALAFVSEQTGKLDDAKHHADEALAKAREDNNGRDQVYPLLVQGRVAARLNDAATAANTFREVAQSPDCPIFLKWEAERSLARLYEDGGQFDAAGREYRIALDTFETARSELKHEDSRLPFLSNAARIYDDYIHFLVAQGRAAEALQVAEVSRGRTLAEGLGLLQKGASLQAGSLDAQAVARRAAGTILFYWLGEKQSYLWAVTPSKTRLFTLPPGPEIDAAVLRYRRALGGPQDVLESADQDGRWLYRTLVGPTQDLLKKDAKVVVIPDGTLNNLNFETLLVSGPIVSEAKLPEPKLHYWIEDVTVANASSLRILGGGARVAKLKRDRSLLLVGNSIAPSDKYPELAKAAAQMESVARHFPVAEQKILTREQATPTAYLAGSPERFSYIHFVAHGTASRLSPLDSAIVLSKPSAENDSFKLYARDIIRHPLRAELVTISACYSAGERAYSGEGLVGLSWAFLRAGTHNVIAALWDASDASTQLLMDRFYDELEKGASPDAALHAAKLSLLRNRGFHNPFYWAPFQLYERLG